MPSVDAANAAAFQPDPKLRADLARRVERIEREVMKEDPSAYDIGEALLEIESLKLFLHAGYRNMTDFLERGLTRLDRTAAWRRLQVAKHFNRPFVMKYGLTKCYYALQIIDVTREKEWPEDVERLKIPARRNGKPCRVRFADATANEVRAEAKLLIERRRSRHPERSVPPKWRDDLEPALALLMPLQARDAPPVISGTRRGLVRFCIPYVELPVLHRALGAVLKGRAH